MVFCHSLLRSESSSSALFHEGTCLPWHPCLTTLPPPPLSLFQPWSPRSHGLRVYLRRCLTQLPPASLAWTIPCAPVAWQIFWALCVRPSAMVLCRQMETGLLFRCQLQLCCYLLWSISNAPVLFQGERWRVGGRCSDLAFVIHYYSSLTLHALVLRDHICTLDCGKTFLASIHVISVISTAYICPCVPINFCSWHSISRVL